eukprot:symbB.v1.2.035868.t1/scaffold4910.1/size43437/1
MAARPRRSLQPLTHAADHEVLNQVPRPSNVSSSKVRKPRQKSWLSWLWGLVWKGFKQAKSLASFVGFLMIVANLKDAGTFTHVNKMLGSAARVTEAAGNAATVLFDKSARLAESTSAGVEVISTSSMSVAKAAWSGVDLVGMKASKFSICIEARSIHSLQMWLLSNDSSILLAGAPTEAWDLWMAGVSSLGWSTPSVTLGRDELSLDGQFWYAFIASRFHTIGHVSMRLIFIDLHFHPRWANPAWELLDLQTEHDQIYEAAVTFASQVETSEPIEIHLKDWDSHTLTARVIAVSTQLIALWEAFLVLAGTGWGGGLMLILLASAKLFFLVRPWLHGVWCGAVYLNVHDMLRRLPFERPFDISQLLASNWPTWMRYLTTLILSARENENQPHGDSESEWSEVMPPS